MASKIVESLQQFWPQWVAALTVTLLCVSYGLVIGWTSPYLALLTSNESTLHITLDEAAWVASLMPFGRLFGAIAGSTILEFFGSKTALLCSGIPVMIGWICIIFANSAMWLYVYRTCAGMSVGMFFSCFSLYVGEIAAPQIRGALVSMIINGMPLGTLFGNLLGTNVSMMWFGIISLVLSCCYILIFPFLPDSPHYYVRKNKIDEAKRAIQWYNRKVNVDAELQEIEKFVRASETVNFRGRFKLMMERKNRRAYFMIIVLYIFMQLSGLNTITFYMEIILQEAQVTLIEPSFVVILSSGISIIIGWIGMYLIDRFGRRVLMVVSCSCVIMVSTLLGLHFTLLDLHYDPKTIEWVPILAMMLFTMISIGLVPVPNTILGELFPADLKSIAGFSVSITAAMFAFICSRTYQPLIDLMSKKCVFWMYALLMTMCLIYSIVAIPETKGKTLQEIQDMLAGNMSREENSEAPPASQKLPNIIEKK